MNSARAGVATGAVNSRPYWDGRFADEWESGHGRDQTRFFAELALALWPQWLASRLRDQRWTLCDWGCALGEGTDTFARAWGMPATGVDFSDVAVRKAAVSYPGCTFVAQDWLSASAVPAAGIDGSWDIVFSSNTLEHFTDPWAVFAQLAQRARHHVVLLLPYEEPELGRSAEHVYRFDRSTIRLCPLPDWVLCDAAVSDLGPSPFWPGQQVLLVYGRGSELARSGFSDACSRHSRLVGPDEQDRDNEVQRDLTEALRQRDLASIKLAELARENRELVQANRELAAVHRQVLDSRSWQLTAPLRRLRARLAAWRR